MVVWWCRRLEPTANSAGRRDSSSPVVDRPRVNSFRGGLVRVGSLADVWSDATAARAGDGFARADHGGLGNGSVTAGTPREARVRRFARCAGRDRVLRGVCTGPVGVGFALGVCLIGHTDRRPAGPVPS